LRGFACLKLANGGVPDATTLLKFRRLLETNDLCRELFEAINAENNVDNSYRVNSIFTVKNTVSKKRGLTEV
jgi:hypothetical protein